MNPPRKFADRLITKNLFFLRKFSAPFIDIFLYLGIVYLSSEVQTLTDVLSRCSIMLFDVSCTGGSCTHIIYSLMPSVNDIRYRMHPGYRR